MLYDALSSADETLPRHKINDIGSCIFFLFPSFVSRFSETYFDVKNARVLGLDDLLPNVLQTCKTCEKGPTT